jgi:hypothetical protein
MSTRPKTTASDIATVLASFKPTRKTVRLCVNGDVLDELQRLDAEMREAGVRDSAVTQRHEALRAQARESEVEFVFVAVGRRRWSDLMLAHPPTPEQLAAAKAEGFKVQFNPETFPIAAVAASCVEPAGMTVEAVEALYEKVNDSQWHALWAGGCLGANVTG